MTRTKQIDRAWLRLTLARDLYWQQVKHSMLSRPLERRLFEIMYRRDVELDTALRTAQSDIIPA